MLRFTTKLDAIRRFRKNEGRKLTNRTSGQQTEVEPKWQATTSIVLGIISMLADVYIVIFYFYPRILIELFGEWNTAIIDPIFLSSLFGGWLFATVGFIFGIMGLKYTRKKLAIAGIVLSVIGFVAYVYLYFMAVRIGQQ